MDVLTNLTVVYTYINMYVYQSITLHTLNLRSVICRLYLNTAGKIKIKKIKCVTVLLGA